jgi:hypothetical protein
MEKRYFVLHKNLGRYANEAGEFVAYKRVHAEAKVFDTKEAAEAFIASKNLVDAVVKTHTVTVETLEKRRPMPKT